MQRIQRLQNEAREIVNGEVVELEQLLHRAAALAASILEAGDACAPGIREACRTISEDVGRQAQMFTGLGHRVRGQRQ